MGLPHSEEMRQSPGAANHDEITQPTRQLARNPQNTQSEEGIFKSLGIGRVETVVEPVEVKGYNERFGILAAIAFFGAGSAFSAVFQDDDRAFRDVLAWSATCFTLGTVLSGAGGTISGVGQIIHGSIEHRWLQGFAILSALFIFAGILLLGVAMISYNPSRAMLSAGIVLVSMSCIFVLVGLGMARCMVVRRRRRASREAKSKRKEP